MFLKWGGLENFSEPEFFHHQIAQELFSNLFHVSLVLLHVALDNYCYGHLGALFFLAVLIVHPTPRSIISWSILRWGG